MIRTGRRALATVLVFAMCVTFMGGCFDQKRAVDKIVFVSTRDGNPEIYMMNLDGSDQTRLTVTRDVDEAWPSISPDGKRIVFCTGYEQLYKEAPISIMDIDGQNRTDLSAEGTNPVFSSDSKEIYYGTGDGIYRIRIDGTRKQCLTEADEAVVFSLSADGAQIAYLAKTDEREWELFMMNKDGSENRQIADLDAGSGDYREGTAGYFDFSPDGGSIIFQCRHDPSKVSESGIYIISLDGADPFLIPDHPYSATKHAYFRPFFSSDGQSIFFAQVGICRPGSYLIHSMTVEGLDQKEITSVEEDLTGKQRVDMSPDGETLVFASLGEENPVGSMNRGDYQLFTVGTDGEGLKQLTVDGNNYQPSYSRGS